MKSNDISSYDLDGEVAVFSQSALNKDGGVTLKVIFNSKGIESEKLLKVCEEFLLDFFNGKVEKGQIRNSKNYLLSSGKDCNVLIVASEPYQIQVTYSSKPITPGVFSITRNPSGLVEELKAVKDKHQLIVKGNLNNNLRTIGKLIPHSPQAKYIRAISDYSLNFSEKDNNLQLEASLNFMLEKYCAVVHKNLEAIKSLLPADKKITLTSEIKNKTGLNVSVTMPLADFQTSLSELEKYLNMSADDLDKQLKEKEKKEKRE